jgi:hypothetical protein
LASGKIYLAKIEVPIVFTAEETYTSLSRLRQITIFQHLQISDQGTNLNMERTFVQPLGKGITKPYFEGLGITVSAIG